MEQSKNSSRRGFLKNTTIASASILGIPQLVSAAFATEKIIKKVTISKNDTVLFQGDSITDAGRKKDDGNVNNPGALGSGYAMLAAAELLYKHADKSLKIYNRGISGNKVYQLAERWQKDCLDLQPNVLSILIGVNDFWHTMTSKYTGTLKTYQDDLKVLLDRTKQKLPGLKIIIGEPFALAGIKAVDEKWYPAFNGYRDAARQIADSFDAAFIPYQSIYDKATKTAPGVYWTGDGVHPTLAGAKLMAHAWMEAVK